MEASNTEPSAEPSPYKALLDHAWNQYQSTQRSPGHLVKEEHVPVGFEAPPYVNDCAVTTAQAMAHEWQSSSPKAGRSMLGPHGNATADVSSSLSPDSKQEQQSQQDDDDVAMHPASQQDDDDDIDMEQDQVPTSVAGEVQPEVVKLVGNMSQPGSKPVLLPTFKTAPILAGAPASTLVSAPLAKQAPAAAATRRPGNPSMQDILAAVQKLQQGHPTGSMPAPGSAPTSSVARLPISSVFKKAQKWTPPSEYTPAVFLRKLKEPLPVLCANGPSTAYAVMPGFFDRLAEYCTGQGTTTANALFQVTDRSFRPLQPSQLLTSRQLQKAAGKKQCFAWQCVLKMGSSLMGMESGVTIRTIMQRLAEYIASDDAHQSIKDAIEQRAAQLTSAGIVNKTRRTSSKAVMAASGPLESEEASARADSELDDTPLPDWPKPDNTLSNAIIPTRTNSNDPRADLLSLPAGTNTTIGQRQLTTQQVSTLDTDAIVGTTCDTEVLVPVHPGVAACDYDVIMMGADFVFYDGNKLPLPLYPDLPPSFTLVQALPWLTDGNAHDISIIMGTAQGVGYTGAPVLSSARKKPRKNTQINPPFSATVTHEAAAAEPLPPPGALAGGSERTDLFGSASSSGLLQGISRAATPGVAMGANMISPFKPSAFIHERSMTPAPLPPHAPTQSLHQQQQQQQGPAMEMSSLANLETRRGGLLSAPPAITLESIMAATTTLMPGSAAASALLAAAAADPGNAAAAAGAAAMQSFPSKRAPRWKPPAHVSGHDMVRILHGGYIPVSCTTGDITCRAVMPGDCFFDRLCEYKTGITLVSGDARFLLADEDYNIVIPETKLTSAQVQKLGGRKAGFAWYCVLKLGKAIPVLNLEAGLILETVLQRFAVYLNWQLADPVLQAAVDARSAQLLRCTPEWRKKAPGQDTAKQRRRQGKNKNAAAPGNAVATPGAAAADPRAAQSAMIPPGGFLAASAALAGAGSTQVGNGGTSASGVAVSALHATGSASKDADDVDMADNDGDDDEEEEEEEDGDAMGMGDNGQPGYVENDDDLLSDEDGQEENQEECVARPAAPSPAPAAGVAMTKASSLTRSFPTSSADVAFPSRSLLAASSDPTLALQRLGSNSMQLLDLAASGGMATLLDTAGAARTASPFPAPSPLRTASRLQSLTNANAVGGVGVAAENSPSLQRLMHSALYGDPLEDANSLDGFQIAGIAADRLGSLENASPAVLKTGGNGALHTGDNQGIKPEHAYGQDEEGEESDVDHPLGSASQRTRHPLHHVTDINGLPGPQYQAGADGALQLARSGSNILSPSMAYAPTAQHAQHDDALQGYDDELDPHNLGARQVWEMPPNIRGLQVVQSLQQALPVYCKYGDTIVRALMNGFFDRVCDFVAGKSLLSGNVPFILADHNYQPLQPLQEVDSKAICRMAGKPKHNPWRFDFKLGQKLLGIEPHCLLVTVMRRLAVYLSRRDADPELKGRYPIPGKLYCQSARHSVYTCEPMVVAMRQYLQAAVEAAMGCPVPEEPHWRREKREAYQNRQNKMRQKELAAITTCDISASVRQAHAPEAAGAVTGNAIDAAAAAAAILQDAVHDVEAPTKKRRRKKKAADVDDAGVLQGHGPHAQQHGILLQQGGQVENNVNGVPEPAGVSVQPNSMSQLSDVEGAAQVMQSPLPVFYSYSGKTVHAVMTNFNAFVQAYVLNQSSDHLRADFILTDSSYEVVQPATHVNTMGMGQRAGKAGIKNWRACLLLGQPRLGVQPGAMLEVLVTKATQTLRQEGMSHLLSSDIVMSGRPRVPRRRKKTTSALSDSDADEQAAAELEEPASTKRRRKRALKPKVAPGHDDGDFLYEGQLGYDDLCNDVDGNAVGGVAGGVQLPEIPADLQAMFPGLLTGLTAVVPSQQHAQGVTLGPGGSTGFDHVSAGAAAAFAALQNWGRSDEQ